MYMCTMRMHVCQCMGAAMYGAMYMYTRTYTHTHMVIAVPSRIILSCVCSLGIPVYRSQSQDPGLPIPVSGSRFTDPSLRIPVYRSRSRDPGLPIPVSGSRFTETSFGRQLNRVFFYECLNTWDATCLMRMMPFSLDTGVRTELG
jgi:hypothetical protein